MLFGEEARKMRLSTLTIREISISAIPCIFPSLIHATHCPWMEDTHDLVHHIPNHSLSSDAIGFAHGWSFSCLPALRQNVIVSESWHSCPAGGKDKDSGSDGTNDGGMVIDNDSKWLWSWILSQMEKGYIYYSFLWFFDSLSKIQLVNFNKERMTCLQV